MTMPYFWDDVKWNDDPLGDTVTSQTGLVGTYLDLMTRSESQSNTSNTSTSSSSTYPSPLTQFTESPSRDLSSDESATSRSGSGASQHSASPDSYLATRCIDPSSGGELPKKRPRKKRTGKVIDELRKGAESQTQEEKRIIVSSALARINLAHTSTSSQITTKELADSLGWHLVTLSSIPFDNPTGHWRRHTPLRDLQKAYQQLSRTALQSGRTNGRLDEVIFAVLAAVGSRRSTHSAIVGLDGGSLVRARSSSLDEYASLKLGERRESACRKLVDAAIERIEASGYLDEDSNEAQEVLGLSKMLAFGCYAEPRFTARIIDLLKDQVVNPRNSKAQNPMIHPTDQVLMFDVLQAITNGGGLRISDEEIRSYGWKTEDSGRITILESIETDQPFTCDFGSPDKTSDDSNQAAEYLADMLVARRLSKNMLRSAAFTYRDLVALQRRDSNRQAPLDEVLPILDKMMSSLDDLMQKALLNGTVDGQDFMPHIFVLPQVVLSLLVDEVRRRCRGKSSGAAPELLNKVQCCYLSWLHQFVHYMKLMPKGDILEHTRALMLVRLDFAPGWVEICLNGATQANLGMGPLAKAGFSLDDFRALHTFFKEASGLFASAAKRETDIANALAASSLDAEDSSNMLQGEEVHEDLAAAHEAVEDVMKELVGYL